MRKRLCQLNIIDHPIPREDIPPEETQVDSFLVRGYLADVNLLIHRGMKLGSGGDLIHHVILFPIQPVVADANPKAGTFSGEPIIPTKQVLEFQYHIVLSRTIDSAGLEIAVRVFLPLIPLRDLLPGDYARPELHMIATTRRGDGRRLLLKLERTGIRLIGYNPFTLCRFRRIDNHPAVG